MEVRCYYAFSCLLFALYHSELPLCQAGEMPESIDLQTTAEMQEVNQKLCRDGSRTVIKVWLSTSKETVHSLGAGSPVLPCTEEQKQVSPPSYHNNPQHETRETCPFRWNCTFQETRSPQTRWQITPLQEVCGDGHGLCVPTTIRSVVLRWRGCDEVTGESQWTYSLDEVAVSVSCQELHKDHYAL